jgi:hypothetical protein
LGTGGDVVGDRPVREQADLLDGVADLAPQLGGLALDDRAAVRRISPLVRSIIRLTSRMAVVLPQPDGPTRTQMSPAVDLEAQVGDGRLSAPGYCLWT